MEKIVLEATKREVTGKKVKVLRREGKLPAVVYGYGVEPMPIVLDHKSSSRILANAESSSLIMISLDGKEYPTLVREKQWDYIRRSLTHVDFQVVSMTETIAAQVRIELIGASPAVKKFDAILLTGLNELEVEALPANLPESIEIDISVLAEIGDGIFVRDLVVSSDITLLTDPDAMIAMATARAEEVEETGDMLEGVEDTADEEDEE